MRNLAVPLLLALTACAAPDRDATPPVAEADFSVDAGRPIVQLTVNDQGPYPFVLDTGAAGLTVGRALADELGLAVKGRARVGSPAGGEPVEVDMVSVASIALGAARVEGLDAIVLDMGGEALLGMGVVGPSAWRDYGVVTMDFATNRIAIGASADVADADWTPLGPSAPLLDAPVRVGEVEMPGHIDSGAPHVLSAPTSYAEALPLAGPPVVVGRARTIDREFEILAAPLGMDAHVGAAVVPVGELVLSDLPVANLGAAGLNGLLLTMDWAHDRFALTGRATPSEGGGPRVVVAAPGGGAPFGVQIAVTPGGAPTAAGVVPGSRAQALGVRAGDVFISVNGALVSEMALPDLGAALRAAPVTLVVERDGEEITLTE